MTDPAPAPRPRRVLMTADTVGGVWTYALDLARGLAELNVQTALATMGAPLSPGQWEAARAVPGLQIHESRFALEWMDDPWDDVAAAGPWLLALARELRPDVVHLNGYAHGALAWPAPTVMVGHSCVASWWRAVLGEDAPPRYDRYRAEVRRGLQAADRVVSVSRAMLDALALHYGPLPRAQAIHNGLFHQGLQPAPVREPFVLAAGRLWDPAKNLAALTQAAQGLSWPVRVAGDPRGPDGRLAPAPDVELLGPLDHAVLRGLMAKAALFAHPARYEPFGLAPLEAAASGCALVLGDIPSLREVWGDAAVFVPPGDPAALAAALEALIADPPRRQALAAAAGARARRYDARNVAAAYAALYAEVIARPPPQAPTRARASS